MGVFAVIADDRLDAFGFDFTDYVAFSRDFWRRDKRPCVILTDLFHLLQLAFPLFIYFAVSLRTQSISSVKFDTFTSDHPSYVIFRREQVDTLPFSSSVEYVFGRRNHSP